jgi:hypothetical protein
MIAELRSQRKSRLLLNLVALCLLGAGATSAHGQLLYSFESDTPPLDGWTSALSTIVPSTTLGVTDGTKSMLIDNHGPNFNNDAGVRTQGAGSGTAFTYWDDAALAIAAGNTNVKLEFDFSWDHTNVTSPSWAQFALFVNSTGAGYRQYGTGGFLGGNIGSTFPSLDPAAVADGVTLTSLGPNTVHLAIPMGPGPATDADGLNIGSGPPGTNFYQMGFKTNGGWTGTVDWAIDNIRISGVQVPTTSETIFSWETPDNAGTPAVDERFEGWQEGGLGTNPPHDHSIVMTGATDGTHALQIDRTATASGFTWGSTFVLNSDTDPGPGQTIDPVIQAQIDNLIGKISAADRVAFDVTYQYQDLFPLPNPTFTGFGVHFADETGRQFQAFGDNLNVAGATNPTTATIEIPLSEFVDATDNLLTLTNTGLMTNSDYLRIAISTNTDGAQIYQVDNFRLVTEVAQGVPGDYNDNGVVDGADYVLWRNGGPLQNEVDTPGTVSVADYTEWRARFGNTSGSGSLAGGGVPEPSAAALLIAAIVGSMIGTRRTGRPLEC